MEHAGLDEWAFRIITRRRPCLLPEKKKFNEGEIYESGQSAD